MDGDLLGLSMEDSMNARWLDYSDTFASREIRRRI